MTARQLRQPRLAELISDQLRQQILRGEYPDGALLPKQEDLLEQFRVSPPSMREALRVLETEGLVTVQRGNVGGAIVHQPQTDKVAYMLSLVLQARGVTLTDVSAALSRLDPVCAAECAARPDRENTVVARLRAMNEESRRALADARVFMQSARRFHHELVAGCGNDTLVVLVGTLESLWSAQVVGMTARSTQPSIFEQEDRRQRSLAEHEEIVALIAAGDAWQAAAAAATHLGDRPETSYGFSSDVVVDASMVRYQEHEGSELDD
jgi:GntR family transcriptional regulator, transcriptional repressor for pyruvate dehydrogenase complex